jgi:hypothetical protein
MTSTLSSARPALSTDPWPGHQSPDERPHPAQATYEPFPYRRPSLVRRASRGFTRFVIACAIGVGGTLAWQSYGDEARQKITDAFPQYAWLVPPAPSQAPPVAQGAPETVASAAAPSDLLQIKAISLGLANVQQTVDRLAAGQQQMAGDIARLQAAEQDILQKVSAPPPRPAAPPAPASPPARKPVPLTTMPPSQGTPMR